MQYVAANPGVGMMELAEKFKVSRAAITQNIRILVEADLLELGQVTDDSAARKGCFVKEEKFLLDFHRQFFNQRIYTAEIPIGQNVLPFACRIERNNGKTNF